MNSNTKLILFIQNLHKKIEKKTIFFEIYFANGIFFLFFGFLAGNVFGSFINIFHKSIIWDGFITLFILLFGELISYLIYHSEKRNAFFAFAFIDLNIISKLKLKLKNSKKYSINTNTNFKKIIRYYLISFSQIFEKIFYSIFTTIKTISLSLYLFFLSKHPNISQFYLFYNSRFFLKSLNLFKVGILLGFFIDAFKVGS